METNIKLLPHQMAFRESKSPLKILIGGLGSGKSFSLALESVMHSIMDPGMIHMIISPSYIFAEGTIIVSLNEIFQKVFRFVPGIDYTYLSSKHIYHVHRWNGIIKICSAEKPDSLVGINAASCGIDEAAKVKEIIYRNARERTRHPDAKHRQIFIGSTPDDLNWLFDISEGDKKPSDLDLYRAKTSDNWHLPLDYIPNLTELYGPGPLLEAYLLGKFVNLKGGTAYHGFSDANLYRTPEHLLQVDHTFQADSYEPDPTLPLIVGQDFNYSPNTAIVAQEVNGKIIVFKEYYLDNCDTDAKCDRIVSDFPGFHFQLYMDATANNRTGHGIARSDMDLIEKSFRYTSHEILCNRSNPNRIDRLNSVNAVFKKGQLLITKNCKHLLADIRQIPYEEYANGNIKNNLGHATDALAYAIFYRYPIHGNYKKLISTNRFVL